MESGRNGGIQESRRGKHPNSLKNLKPFKPGHKPDRPGGRPKGTSITALLRDLLEERVVTPQGRVRVKELVARALIREAAKGKPQSLKELIDRVDGPVRQEMTHTIERQVKLIEGVPEDAL